MRKYILLCLVLISVISITGCNKKEKSLAMSDDMASEVMVTTTPNPTPKPTPEPTPTPDINADLFKEQYHFTETMTDDEQGITLNFDADVVPISIENIPVARLEKHSITEDEADRIAQAFFGDSASYVKSFVQTKDQIAYAIEMVKKEGKDLGSALASRTGATTMEELEIAAEKQIAELKKDMANAPDKQPSTGNPKITSSNDYQQFVDMGRSYEGKINFFRQYGIEKYLCQRFRQLTGIQRFLTAFSSESVDIESKETDYLEAKTIADDFMAKANIDGLRLGEVYISRAQSASFGEHIIDSAKYYVFCYERIVGDGAIGYTFNRFEPDENMNIPFSQEKFELWIYDGVVGQFFWYSPDEVGEIVNDNVKVEIDDKQAIELIKDQAIKAYGGGERDVKIDIERIELTLTQALDKNSGEYLVVPAWKCFGALAEKRSDGNYRNLLGRGQVSKNIITINALDGSPIDVGTNYFD